MDATNRNTISTGDVPKLNSNDEIQFLPRPVQREYNRLLGNQVPKDKCRSWLALGERPAPPLPHRRITKAGVTFWPETLVTYFVDRRRGPAAWARPWK